MTSRSIQNLSPTRAQLVTILGRRDGSLADEPYPLLLLAFAVAEKSAVLTLMRPPLEKAIVFDAGVIIDCYSNIATETLGRFLVAAGRISEQDHQSCVAESAARRIPFEEILTARKLVSSSELYRLLQQNLVRNLLDPFSWSNAKYEISLEAPPVESSLRIRVPQLIVTGITKVEPQESIDAALADAGNLALGLPVETLIAADEIRLSPEQQAVVDAAKSGTVLADLRRTSAIPADELHRAIYSLTLIGAVTLKQPAPAQAAAEAPSLDNVPFFELDIPEPLLTKTQSQSAQAATPAAAPPQKTEPEPVAAAAAEEVMAAYLSFRRKDAFDLLNLPPTAGMVQITRAFLETAERFIPSKFPTTAPDGLHEKAQEVFLAAALAYAELFDPIRRKAVAEKRSKKETESVQSGAAPWDASAPPPVEAQPVPAKTEPGRRPRGAMIDPEALWRQGRQLADAGKIRDALSYFEMAAESDAQNGNYAAEVAYCKYQLTISPATAALSNLKNAMRIDQRAGLAYLYTGKIHAMLGNKIEAESYLRRAVSLMPRDRRAADALNALV